jgi:hypothetical protein
MKLEIIIIESIGAAQMPKLYGIWAKLFGKKKHYL